MTDTLAPEKTGTTGTGKDSGGEMRRRVERIMIQVDSWRELNWDAEEFYQEQIRHFNGGALVVDTSGEGREYASNFNIARSRLLKISRERHQSYYSKLGIFELKVIRKDMKDQAGMELAANEALARVLRADLRFFPNYGAIIDDAILAGRGVLWRSWETQSVPKWGRILCHPDCLASQRDDSFAEWAFADSITAGELFRIARKSKSAGIRSQAKRILDKILERNTTDESPLNFTSDEPWELYDDTMRSSRNGLQALNTVIPCYWYFEKDMSGPPNKRPVSVYCVARHGVDLSVVKDDNGNKSVMAANAVEGLIFERKNAFKDSGRCLWLFTIGAQFGGKPTMGRLKGEGAIQYPADIRIQKMLNSLMLRVEVENKILYKPTAGAVNQKKLEDLQGRPLRDGDVIPDGVDFVLNRFSDKPITQMMGLVSELMNFAADHAAVDTGHVDAPRQETFKDQVLERLQDRASAKSITESKWADCLDMLARTLGDLFFDMALTEEDEAWEFREMFLQEMKDAGYEMKASDLKKAFRVSARRQPGHGDPGVAMARADMNIALAQMSGPEALAKAIFEKAVLVAGGDVQKAINMFGEPAGGKPMTSDAQEAQIQMALILSSGINLEPQPGDNPMIHAAVQMTVLEQALGGHQQDGGWTKEDARAWDAGLAHTIKDVMRVPDDDMRKPMLKRIKQVQQAAAGFAIFEQGQPPVDPAKQADLQLKAQELQRKKDKDADATRRWEISQQHREDQSGDNLALQQHSIIASGSRADREQASKESSRRIGDALALRKQGAGNPTAPDQSPQPEPDTDIF